MPPPENIVCECTDLRVSYGRRRIIDGCSFTVERGQVVGLTGENGSGKSTLVKCLLGFLRPKGGHVYCDPRAGYCPQENYLHRAYTVAEHLQLVASLHPGGLSVDPAFLARSLTLLKLDRYLGYRIRRLSGGTYQKLKFFTAAAHRPPLLVLDEPTDGFDWAMYLVFWDLVRELVASGTGVLLISHLVHDRQRFDRILELRDGVVHG